MKKLLAAFCLFSLLTAFTCENEPLDFEEEVSETNNPGNTDDPDNTGTPDETDPNLLLGDWQLVEFSADLNTSTEFMGQTVSSDVQISSTTVNYNLNFTETNFTTNGSYSYETEITANGIEVPQETYTLTDVSGSGSYTTDGNEITIDGSFFEFSFDGMDFDELTGPQTVMFQFSNNGQTLTFTQNETTTDTQASTGATVTTTQVSTSVWTRQ